jgi:CRP/FNR family transcriptional regulator, anaerobic regulatory protein
MDASFLLLPESPPRSLSTSRRRMRAGDFFASGEASPSMEIRRVAARACVFSAGEAAAHVHEVAQGAVMISRRLPDGRRQIVDIVGPGRLFGFAGDTHDCSAEALTQSIVCSLDRAAGERHPQIAARFVQAMGAEIRRLRDLTLLLGRKTALERVATFFAAMVGDEGAARATIALPVTRSEIADHLGLTIETVSRNVTKLKKMALLGEDRGDEITVLDVAGLRAIAVGAGDAD